MSKIGENKKIKYNKNTLRRLLKKPVYIVLVSLMKYNI